MFYTLIPLRLDTGKIDAVCRQSCDRRRRYEVATGDQCTHVGIMGENIVVNEFREKMDQVGKGKLVVFTGVLFWKT